LLSDLDHGARCERHVGEVFPPRCDECTALAKDVRPAHTPRIGYVVGTECTIHPFYPLPCEHCARVQLERNT
jgi:hypothetical protein